MLAISKKSIPMHTSDLKLPGIELGYIFGAVIGEDFLGLDVEQGRRGNEKTEFFTQLGRELPSYEQQIPPLSLSRGNDRHGVGGPGTDLAGMEQVQSGPAGVKAKIRRNFGAHGAPLQQRRTGRANAAPSSGPCAKTKRDNRTLLVDADRDYEPSSEWPAVR
jgi:hypothetical protein